MVEVSGEGLLVRRGWGKAPGSREEGSGSRVRGIGHVPLGARVARAVGRGAVDLVGGGRVQGSGLTWCWARVGSLGGVLGAWPGARVVGWGWGHGTGAG